MIHHDGDYVKDSLLILGAGQYGSVAKEIAESMGCYGKIGFLDDAYCEGQTDSTSPTQPMGKIAQLDSFRGEYTHAIAAVGNAKFRRLWTEKILECGYKIPILVSPLAFVSSSALLQYGDIVEPMTVVNTVARLGIATYVSAGAVINHNAVISDYCHIDCNAVILSGGVVEADTHVLSCEVIK